MAETPVPRLDAKLAPAEWPVPPRADLQFSGTEGLKRGMKSNPHLQGRASAIGSVGDLRRSILEEVKEAGHKPGSVAIGPNGIVVTIASPIGSSSRDTWDERIKDVIARDKADA